jgi:hypothetical protein
MNHGRPLRSYVIQSRPRRSRQTPRSDDRNYARFVTTLLHSHIVNNITQALAPCLCLSDLILCHIPPARF